VPFSALSDKRVFGAAVSDKKMLPPNFKNLKNPKVFELLKRVLQVALCPMKRSPKTLIAVSYFCLFYHLPSPEQRICLEISNLGVSMRRFRRASQQQPIQQIL
jgi:hypothetical protein